MTAFVLFLDHRHHKHDHDHHSDHDHWERSTVENKNIATGNLCCLPSSWSCGAVCVFFVSLVLASCAPDPTFNPHVCLSVVDTAAWIGGFVSITVISLLSLLGVILIPLMSRVFFKFLLSFLVALAVGTLSGDAFLHLIPHVSLRHLLETLPV